MLIWVEHELSWVEHEKSFITLRSGVIGVMACICGLKCDSNKNNFINIEHVLSISHVPLWHKE